MRVRISMRGRGQLRWYKLLAPSRTRMNGGTRPTHVERTQQASRNDVGKVVYVSSLVKAYPVSSLAGGICSDSAGSGPALPNCQEIYVTCGELQTHLQTGSMVIIQHCTFVCRVMRWSSSRVDLHIPALDTVGGYSFTTAPHQLQEEGLFGLAIQHSDHPPTLWMTTQVIEPLPLQ